MKIINVALSSLFIFLCFSVDARPRKDVFDDHESCKKRVEAFKQKQQKNTTVKAAEKSKTAAAEKQIDPLESQCKKVYKNIYYERREQKNQQYFSNNGRLSFSKKITHVIGSSYVYSFRLFRKLNDSSGLFIPICDSRSYSNDYDRRFTDEENTYILIVNYDLSDFAENDIIKLKDNEKLYSIGTYTTKTGRTFRKFTFNRNDVIQYLNRKKNK